MSKALRAAPVVRRLQHLQDEVQAHDRHVETLAWQGPRWGSGNDITARRSRALIDSIALVVQIDEVLIPRSN